MNSNKKIKTKNSSTKTIKQGVVNLGYEYEKLVPAYFAVKFLNDPTVESFSFKLNSSSFRKFDDLIITVQNNSNSIEKFAFQLKHRQRGRDVLNAVEEFVGKKSEKEAKTFNISHYLKAYNKEPKEVQESHRFVLFTNAKFENVDEDQDYEIEEVKSPFNTNSLNSGIVYKFRSSTTPGDSDDEFYKHFFLLSAQKNVEELENSIKDIFKNDFSADENAITRYIEFFGKLRAGSYNNTEITKDEVIFKLTDLLLLRHSIEVPLVEKRSNKVKLLEDAIIKRFDLAFIKTSDKSLIETKWQYLSSNRLTQKDIGQLQNFKILKKDDNVQETKLKIQVLCFFEQKPLFICVNKHIAETVYKVVHLCRKIESFKIKFVLVGEDIKENHFAGWKIFQNLADLKNETELYQDFTDILKISLQGRAATSISAVKLDKFVTLNDILKHDDVLFLGTKMGPLPEPFIPRRLLVTSMSCKFLKNISEEKPPLIYCGGNADAFRRILLKLDRDLKVATFAAYEQNPGDHEGSVVLITDRRVDKQHFSNNFHFLKLAENSKSNALAYISSRFISAESELFDGQLNVICGDSGIGKTTMMKYLASRCPLEYWIVNVPLRQSKYFLRSFDNIQELLQDFLNTGNVTETDRRIVEHFQEKKKLVFLLDGLDELNKENIATTIVTIKELARNGYKIFIFCSRNLLHTLQSNLELDFTFDIEALTRTEQINFVSEKLRKSEKSESYIEKAINNIFGNELIKINMLKLPLFLNILTDILPSNEDLNNIQDILSSVEIYSRFIEGQFRHYFKKMNFDPSAYSAIAAGFKSYYFKEYKIGALKACLEPSHFEALGVTNDPDFINQVKTNDVLGLVLRVNDDNTFVFSHHTLAEYFAAMWFSGKVANIPLEQRKMLFHPKYVGIRYFFDLKLAEGCPFHLAILKQDVAKVKKLAEAHSNDLDQAGRTALHLTSSLGKNYPLLTEATSQVSYSQNKTVQEEILEHVLSLNIDPLEKDALFQWNCFQYAYACCSLNCLEKLAEMKGLHLNDYLNLRQFEDKEARSYLLMAIENGYHNLIKFLIKHEIDLGKTDSRLYTPLHEAALWGRTEAVALLLEKNVNIEAKDVRGKTPLQYACKMGYDDIVMLLIKKGADVNTRDGFQKTPLEKASYMGNTALVKILLEHGAYINSKNTDKCTALHLAAHMGHQSTVECLLDHGANIEAAEMYERTALHFAVVARRKSVVEYLVTRNANVSAKDEEGKTALKAAEEKGFGEIVEILGKAQSYRTENDSKRCSHLHQAARQNDLPRIKQFLSEDSLTIEQSDHNNQTILHIACYEGHEALVDYLLEKEANLNAQSHDGRHPLHFAAQRGHCSIIKKLLKYEGQMDIVDNFGRTPLHRAAYKGHLEAVKVLIDAGLNPSTTYYKEETSLHSAARGGNNDIIDYLISKGAKVEAKNRNEETCLHLAAQLGCTETVEHLVDGMRTEILNEVDIRGRTALHWAAEKGYKTMVKVLIKGGANIHVRDNRKETALDIARKQNRKEIVEYLDEHTFCYR